MPPQTLIRLNDMHDDWDEIREVPKRTPIDWRDHPITATMKKLYVMQDAVFLDNAFKRLYNGSATFRALIEMNPSVATKPTMVNVFNSSNGAVRVQYDEVDINPSYMHNDDKGFITLWILAHEYRHLLQFENGAAIFEDNTLVSEPTASLASYLALHRAGEGDSNAFAATCLFEVLTHEGRPPHEIETAMAGSALDRVMRTLSGLSNEDSAAHHNGDAASLAFHAFFHPSNKNILRLYDRNLLRIFTSVTEPSADEEILPDAFEDRFRRLKTMPYLSKSGTAIERDWYMAEAHFNDLKQLPHTGIRNIIRMKTLAIQWPWKSNP